MPEHWEVKPLFAVAKERQEKNLGMKVANVLSLSYGRIIPRDVDNGGLLPDSFETYQIVDENNIILRLTDLQNDHKSLRVGLVRQRGIITSAYVCLETREMLSALFAALLLHSYDVQKVFYSQGGGVRQTMNFDNLKRLPMLVPPISEQREIVAFIEREVRRIEAVVTRTTREIELMRELRASLIAQAVGGKMDVRAAQWPLQSTLSALSV